MDPHKVLVRRSAFSAFPSAWNEGEPKKGIESERLKHQFSQVERDLNLQEMSKLVPIPKKSTRKKTIMVSCAYAHPFYVLRVKKKN
jgi:hypothetical protein